MSARDEIKRKQAMGHCGGIDSAVQAHFSD